MRAERLALDAAVHCGRRGGSTCIGMPAAPLPSSNSAATAVARTPRQWRMNLAAAGRRAAGSTLDGPQRERQRGAEFGVQAPRALPAAFSRGRPRADARHHELRHRADDGRRFATSARARRGNTPCVSTRTEARCTSSPGARAFEPCSSASPLSRPRAAYVARTPRLKERGRIVPAASALDDPPTVDTLGHA